MAPSDGGPPDRWLKLPQEVRRLFGLGIGLTLFGLIYGGTSAVNVASSMNNHHRFQQGQQVSATVDSTQRTKGVYASIVLTYAVDGSEYKSAVKDPNTVDEELTVGQTVDAIYLPTDPQSVAIAGQYGSGFQSWSIFAAGSGTVMVIAGLTCLFLGIRAHRERAQSNDTG